MNIQDEEFMEWHRYVKAKRDRYRNFIQDIITGIPSITGMASEYRQLTLKEIKDLGEKLLREDLSDGF